MTDAFSPVLSDGYVRDLNDHCVTIGQVLQSAGYGTYAVGKWHVTKEIAPDAADKHNWPMHRGFDRYYGTIMGAGSFFDPALLCRGDKAVSAFADPEYQPPAGQPYYYTDAIGDQACRFIREHGEKSPGKPFFLYVAFTAAHWPMQALPEDIARYKGVYDGGYEPIRQARFEREKKQGLIDPAWDLSPRFGQWEKVADKSWEARGMEVYAAMLDRMDQNIGRIVQALRDRGQLDNTLLLYLQDNGGNYEPTGRDGKERRADRATLTPQPAAMIQTQMRPRQTRDGWPVLDGRNVLPGPADTYIAYGKAWANVSNTPFREYKHFVHEGGIATPLIAHWPGGISRKGGLEKQPGHLIDLMATCVDLAGAVYPKQLDGHDIYPMEGTSLRPAFAGQPLAGRSLFWEHEGNRAMRQGDWKLVAKYPAGKWESTTSPPTGPRCMTCRRPRRRGWRRWSAIGKPGPGGATCSPGRGSPNMGRQRGRLQGRSSKDAGPSRCLEGVHRSQSMDRDTSVNRLFTRGGPWDMAVIGGGATGVGIALDAASRGYAVCLVEQSDFGKGTSSRSTKLVHGGVRYLQQGNISLVMEALKERGILRQNAPHLVHDLAFIVPNYVWWEAPFYGIGMKVYDMLAGKYGFGKSRLLSKQEVVEHIPTLKAEGLRGGVLYYDGQFDDSRLLIDLAQTADRQGAVLLNYARAVGLTHDADGFLDGLVVRDMESGREHTLAARCVINATGAFSDAVRRIDDPAAVPMIAPSQGVHLVLDRSFLPGESAIMVPHTSDRRVMFAIPWHNRTLVGTTDTPIKSATLEPVAMEEEIDFILETASQYLAKRPRARTF